MYQRTTQSGHTVRWTPKDEDVGAEAVAMVDAIPASTPEEARNMDIIIEEQEVHNRVRETYHNLLIHELRLSLEDGELASGGEDTETVTIEVLDGFGERREQDFTAYLNTDHGVREVSLTDGVGSTELTTAADPGSTLSVEVIELADVPNRKTESAKRRAIDVV